MAACDEAAARGGVVLVIVDGLSDVSLPALRGGSPLSAAALPTLDALSAAGQCGLLDPVAPGLACGSDTAHLALFGFEPRSCYRGRGAFEAEGDGLEIRPGDVAFKCNFAHMDDETGVVTQRCAARGALFHSYCEKECRDKLDGVGLPSFPNVSVSVKHAHKHRCVVRLRAAPGVLSDAVTDTDPLVDGEAIRPSAAIDPTSRPVVCTAAAVNELHAVLRSRLVDFGQEAGGPPRRAVLSSLLVADKRARCPNVVLLRGASERINVATSFEALHGLAAFLIAPTKIIAGIGKTVGIAVQAVEGATGDYATNFSKKADAAAAFMLETRDGGPGASHRRRRYDLGVVHIKAVDDACHAGDLAKKVKHLEDVDGMVRRMAGGLVAGGRDRVRIIVTGDHTSPVSYRDHSCEPVPCIVAPAAAALVDYTAEAGWHADGVSRFEETDVGTHGCLGRFKGLELMSIVKHHVSTSNFAG
jgi:2,3-diphosphopglycerate-independent phosphoglycerate mutase